MASPTNARRLIIPSSVRIVEVGPRDGLQNEREILSTDDKLEFIRLLAESGLEDIEATSFVSPTRIPQLADAEQLFKELAARQNTNIPTRPHIHTPTRPVKYSALVPNQRGLGRALSAGCRAIAVFTAASDRFNQKNIGVAIAESLDTIREVVPKAKSAGCWVRAYISTAFHCPYEGPIAPGKVLEVTEKLLEIGADEISIGDTIGHAVPTEIARLTEKLYQSIPAPHNTRTPDDQNIHTPTHPYTQTPTLAYHFHDTRGTALANVLMALEYGVAVFDSSAGGAGGCPFAPGAAGNLATEDLVYMLNGMGIETGVDLAKLVAASRFLEARLGHPLPGRYLSSR